MLCGLGQEFIRAVELEKRNLLAKNLILQIVGEILVAGPTYRLMEFVGTAVEATTMEDRMSLCNMVLEAGGKNGVVPADATTSKYLEGKTSKPYQVFTSDGNARNTDLMFPSWNLLLLSHILQIIGVWLESARK